MATNPQFSAADALKGKVLVAEKLCTLHQFTTISLLV